MSLVKISKKYFEAFSNKDLGTLKELFSDSITLRDWETKKNGKNNVLAFNEKLFKSVKKIQVIPLKIYKNDNTVIAELDILIDNLSAPLKVVDVIVFDESNCICAIRAYKG